MTDRTIPHRLAPIVLDADGVPVIDTAYQQKLAAARVTEPGTGVLVTPTSMVTLTHDPLGPAWACRCVMMAPTPRTSQSLRGVLATRASRSAASDRRCPLRYAGRSRTARQRGDAIARTTASATTSGASLGPTSTVAIRISIGACSSYVSASPSTSLKPRCATLRVTPRRR